MMPFNENDENKRLSVNNNNENDQIINDSETRMLEYLHRMGKILNGDKIDLNEFRNTVDALENLKKSSDHEYLNTLVNPEKTRGAKIPSVMPIPSSSFQLKQSFNVTTNASGNAIIVFNPFFLAGSGSSSSVYINNSPTLTGTASDDNFTSVNIGQVIPPVYNQYRLVSGSIIAKYIGRLDIVQGIIGGAIVFDNVDATTVGTVNSSLAKYGDYNIAQDSFFQQEHLSLQGMRELYFPLDTTYEQYRPLNSAKTGFANILYIMGAPPSVSSYKIDVFLNFECLPDSSFLNYVPTSICQTPAYNKEFAIRTVQNRPLTKEDERVSYKKSDFWEGAIRKFGSILPNLASIANFIPKLKPLMGIAGSMIQ